MVMTIGSRSEKYGLVAGRVRALMTQRYWEKVEIGRTEDACWPWRGNTISGYASLTIPLHRTTAIYDHVFGFFLANGRWPEEGKLVCHKCNEKTCQNPAHLYEGTAKTNRQDRLRELGYEHADAPAWEAA